MKHIHLLICSLLHHFQPHQADQTEGNITSVPATLASLSLYNRAAAFAHLLCMLWPVSTHYELLLASAALQRSKD